MNRDWLEAELAAGRSIESLAREVGRHPSTVAYWVNQHGLASAFASKHARKGGVEREQLVELVERGLSIEAIAIEVGLGATAVRHWLRRYDLRTERARALPLGERPRDGRDVLRLCRRHGYTIYAQGGSKGRYRCKLCRSEHVAARRRRVKALLVAEAGGSCRLCGYDRHPAALQFHHLDPATKAFGLATQGVARSLARAREEAAKCVLVCANCHAEVEAGIATIPPRIGRSPVAPESDVEQSGKEIQTDRG
jgi:transposase-like protein